MATGNGNGLDGHLRITGLVFGVFCLSILLTSSHISSVYRRFGARLEFSKDDSDFVLDQPGVSNFPGIATTITTGTMMKASKVGVAKKQGKAGKNPKGAKYANTNTGNSSAAGVVQSLAERVERQKQQKATFWERHVDRKSKYVLETVEASKATTLADRKAAQTKAEALFVDLERDTIPPRNNTTGGETKADEQPWLILHIGPPKTATTALQCGLEKYSLRLAKTDGYHYMGGGCGLDRKDYYMPNGEQTVLRMQILMELMALHQDSISHEHTTKFANRSSLLQSKGRSVILSSEIFGSRLRSSANVMHRMKQLLTKRAGFDSKQIRIVLAYRHFVDWLPSYYYQKFSFHSHDIPFAQKNADPASERILPFLHYADEYLSNWETYQQTIEQGGGDNKINVNFDKAAELNDDVSDGGDDGNDNEEEDEDAKPLVNNLPKDRLSIHPSWWLYQLWSYYFPLPDQVQVYDMHSPMNSHRPHDDVVTNFVCNVLPNADRTCAKLMQMEDDRESETETNNNKNSTQSSSSNQKRRLDEDDEPDYDNLDLHDRMSYLHQKKKPETASTTGSKLRASLSSGGDGGSISIRTSSDLDAVRIVEELLIHGDIPMFDKYDQYGPLFFTKPRTVNETSKEFHKGYNKKELINYVQTFLDEHHIKAPDPEFYDCMPQELEDRLLAASLTFVDLIYTHTKLLTHSAQASHIAAAFDTATNHQEAMEEEKRVRLQQALEEHARLFEKNKAKGKYCDIVPSKVFRKFPGLLQQLKSLSFMPRYYTFKFLQLPEHALAHIETLGFDAQTWNKYRHKKPKLQDLSPQQKASAFYLGYYNQVFQRK